MPAPDAFEQLLDHKAIVDLTIRYAWAIDERRYGDLRHVFTPDAWALLGGTECDGREAIIDRIDRALTRLDASQHLLGNHQVTVAPDGATATARCSFQAQHLKRGTLGGDNVIIAGRYEDELRRTDDGWRITRRHLIVDWTDGNPAVTRRES
jgi:hypothetical protein